MEGGGEREGELTPLAQDFLFIRVGESRLPLHKS